MHNVRYRAYVESESRVFDVKLMTFNRDGLVSVRIVGVITPAWVKRAGLKQQSYGSKTDIVMADNLRLLQYTGLKDKHGVEICEGDILRYVPPPEWDDGSPNRDTYEVRWKGYGFDARWLEGPPNTSANALDDCDKDMEVIGNVFENPELLSAAAAVAGS